MGRVKSKTLLSSVFRIPCSIFTFALLFCVLHFALCTVVSGAFMPVDKIKPGMKGFGKTVFEGTKIKEFGVEILGTLKLGSARGDIVLARLSGEPLEKTGVIAGMSGSPVYIDSQLVGAIAFTWSFQKEPIAGITPIGEMTEIIRAPQKLGNIEQGFKVESGETKTIPIPLAIDEDLINVGQALKQVALFGRDFVQGSFEKYYNFIVTPGGGGTSEADFDLQPGAPVGVLLIDGDLRASAIGTLTYRKGDTVLAFGHPMFLAGDIEFPMVGGVIHSVMPSQQISFKLFSPTEILGTIYEDRRTGIMGVIGKFPKLLPIKVAIRDTRFEKESFSYQIVQYKPLAPTLFQLCLLNSIIHRGQVFDDYPVSGNLEIFLKPIEVASATPRNEISVKTRRLSSEGALTLIPKLVEPLETIFEQGFWEVKVDSVKVNLELSSRKSPRCYYLEKAFWDKNEVRPGDTLDITLFIRPEKSESLFTRDIQLIIPKEITPHSTGKELTVLITNSDTMLFYESIRAPDLLKPGNFSELAKFIENQGMEDELVISLYSYEAGIVSQGKELPAPPVSFREVVSRSQTFKKSMARLLAQTRVKFDRIVLGLVRFNIQIKSEK